MDYNRNMTEVLALVGGINSNAGAAGTFLSNAIQIQPRHRRILFIVNVGTPGAGGTVDAKVRWSATSGGTYADVAGAAIVQATAAGWAMIEVKLETLAKNSQGPFLKLSLTVGTATTPIAATALATCDAYEAAADFNATGVAAAVVV